MWRQKCTVGQSPRILIVRLSAIGDVIHAIPLLGALRERFPKAHLSWLVEGHAGCLLEGHRALDELIQVPRRWLKSPRRVAELRRRLRQLAPEVTIDVQGLSKSAIAARLSGAKQRIGFGDEKGRELSRLLNNRFVRATSRHIIDANLELLRPLGIESPTAHFDVPEFENHGQSARRMILEAGISDRFAVINVGAGWPSKLWRPDRYGLVARHLGNNQGLPTMIVWAGREEYNMARQVVVASAGQAVQAPETSLCELAALSRRASLFIGSDTGPLHIAAAVGTPCVGLYGPMPADRNGPYGPRNVALQAMSSKGTSRRRRTASRQLMDAITVTMVRDACDQILQPANTPSPATLEKIGAK